LISQNSFLSLDCDFLFRLQKFFSGEKVRATKFFYDSEFFCHRKILPTKSICV
jgi:hypothetical protein